MLTVEQREEFLGTLYNPRWINSDYTGSIILDGVFNGQKMTFFASQNDSMEYGRKIYERVIKGDYGEILEPESEEVK